MPIHGKDDEKRGDGQRKRSRVDDLLDLVAGAELFHTPEGEGFTRIQVGGHYENHPIRGEALKNLLTHKYYAAIGQPPRSWVVRETLDLLEARARYDGEEMEVHVRVTRVGNSIFLDLCDNAWRCVEVTADGWGVTADPPIRFRRFPGMLSLPEPQRGGSVEELREFLNISPRDFVLCVGWLLGGLSGRGPYLVLVLTGEQGTAKTMGTRLLRNSIDPSVAALRAPSRGERNLAIASVNSHVISFDNVSELPKSLSDALCRIATSGGYVERALFTDRSEVFLAACKPIVMNGISSFVTRGDLISRAIFIRCDPIPEDRRRTERELLADFERAHPRILGALLDGVACGLREEERISLDQKPRMADFARWVTACEGKMPWTPKTFMSAYLENIADATEAALEDDPVAEAIQNLATENRVWRGTAKDLLGYLDERVTKSIRRLKEWPTTPRGLRSKLDRVVTALRRAGVEIELGRREPTRKRARIISIWKVDIEADADGSDGHVPHPREHSLMIDDATTAVICEEAQIYSWENGN